MKLVIASLTACLIVLAPATANASPSTYDKETDSYTSVAEARKVLEDLQASIRIGIKEYKAKKKSSITPLINKGAGDFNWDNWFAPILVHNPKIYSTHVNDLLKTTGVDGTWDITTGKYYFNVSTIKNKHWVKARTTTSCTSTGKSTSCTSQYHPAHWDGDYTYWKVTNGAVGMVKQ